ncbi:hypothetical protein D0867_00863 [Hortaea werneckii]|uniref:EthD domain-containing protein n=1 Tax=Hortaea werneckii TaxID=91943 RepID=A0A3M7ACK1_HORWE|nr:hypothetical protein D0867_00863 [Hortaea werneckii]
MATTTQTTMPETVQVLLKCRPGTTVAAFRAYYQNHHAKLVLPWGKANGVTYYAQIHGPLTWTKPHSAPSEAATSGAAPPPATSTSALNINLEDWDAAAEMVLPPDFQLKEMKEKEYYEKVILPDERKFLFDEARAHMVVLAAGSVEGERVEVIRDGAVVPLGKEEGKGGECGSGQGERR